jgi:hypothetical protein
VATKLVKALLAIVFWAPKRLFGFFFGGRKTAKSLPKPRAVVSALTEPPTSEPASEKKLLEAIALKERNAKYQAIQDTMSTGNMILERMNGKPLTVAPASISIPAAPTPSPVAVVVPAPKVVVAEPAAETSNVPPPASIPGSIAKPLASVAPVPAPISKPTVAAAAPILKPTMAVAASVAEAATSSENMSLTLEAQQAVLVVAAVGIAIATAAIKQH